LSYQFDFSPVWENWDKLAFGAVNTLVMVVVSMALALILALATVLMRMSSWNWVSRIAVAYIEIIRNTPFLLQLYFFFFGLPALGLSMTPNVAAVAALAMNGGAYGAEIIRGGMLAVDRGQQEAGAALGLSKLAVYRYIVLKPAVRAVYPALTGQFILLFLASSVISAISATDLTSAAQILDSVTFRSFEIYFSVTLIYLALSVAFSRMFNVIGSALFRYPVK
jgi:polar amino acid transport system permease protein